MSRKGIPAWVKGLVALALFLALLVAIFIPPMVTTQVESNERNASTTLKTLSTAEADFRANDRDWNRVSDFWTGDVKSLYTLTSAETVGVGAAPKDEAIRLIEQGVALADADPTFLPAGGENLKLDRFGPSAAKAGYWYAALLSDLTLNGQPEGAYRTDTGGTPGMGKVHNPSKYGFSAIPDNPKGGRVVFIVNENNTVFRMAATTAPLTKPARPPGLDGIAPAYLNWPDDTPKDGKYRGD